MSSDNLGWIEIIFVAVIALGVGFWQLFSINREIRRDRERKQQEQQQSGDARHLVREHPLDDR